FGRAAVFSFYPSKTLPALGDGGAILTDDDEVAARCLRLRDHGRIDKNVHAEVGFNLRYNELQAAALRVLLPRLDAMNDRRRALAARYAEGLAGLPLVLPAERASARHVYHLFVVRTSRLCGSSSCPRSRITPPARRSGCATSRSAWPAVATPSRSRRRRTRTGRGDCAPPASATWRFPCGAPGTCGRRGGSRG